MILYISIQAILLTYYPLLSAFYVGTFWYAAVRENLSSGCATPLQHHTTPQKHGFSLYFFFPKAYYNNQKKSNPYNECKKVINSLVYQLKSDIYNSSRKCLKDEGDDKYTLYLFIFYYDAT